MIRPNRRFYEFDAFRIDVEERRLLRDGEPVRLTAKVFDILLVLVENRGHTLEKDDLLDRVWADAFVEEGSLNRNISTLRKALGEDFHEPRFITTIPRRGYRFDGDVREFIEEDETVVVEQRANYRIAVRQTTETETESGTKRNSFRSVVAGAIAAALLIFAAVWAIDPTGIRSTRSQAAEIKVIRGTENSEAFALYEKGRKLWQNRSVDGLHQATADLERAVALDPNFALAHAALADAYAFDINNWAKAEATANEAIRLDPTLGQPHATIGFVRMFWEWKVRVAERHFRKAIDLSPENATAHQWYALNLAAMARGGEALGSIKRALELEPDSVAINADLCQVLNFSRKYDLAIDQCTKTLEMDPNFHSARVSLYEAYTAKEMYPEAVREYLRSEEANMTSVASHRQIEELTKAFAAGGIRSFWRQRIEMLKSPIPNGAYTIARYHLRLGERDEALRWFGHAYDNREFGFIFLVADPAHAELNEDPRFLKLAELLLD